MAYRNQTYVAFASEDLHNYNLMRAWKANENIAFDFHNAHDKNVALDTSKPETIKTRLRERLQNTKQAVLLASNNARTKAADKDSFLAYEITLLLAYKIPVIIANLDGSRDLVTAKTPATLLNTNQTMMVTSFQPKIIQYALDDFVERFGQGEYKEPQTLRYNEALYKRLGL